MKLSIVIVNYNVEHFLEQCLYSVEKAISGLDAEVWVVDNNSVDGSLAMVAQKFPWVKCIANSENLGFSRGNNQAISKATGDYVLLLNPDTIIEIDTLSKTLAFMDEHPDAGGLGVKMVDGKGNFLPESKRGLPTPEVAFYKIFGLAKLFRKSKRFGRYHLTYLSKDETNPVDVLSGAFMMVRKETLEKVGLLDEDYFMYGEDIDWSYRITKAGYKNYYFADTTIIHYKGESTKKGSLNYVFVFYNAMRIFARKHFLGKSKSMFILIINFAIYFRAFLSVSKRFFQQAWLPVSDFLLVYGAMFLLKNWWEEVLLFNKSNHFPEAFIQVAVPAYIGIWLYGIYLARGYSKMSKPSKITKGVVVGTVAILVLYALLPEHYRYSRAMIVIGAAVTITVTVLWRLVLNALRLYKFSFGDVTAHRFLVVGNSEEGQRVVDILRRTNLNPEFIGLITLQKEPDCFGYLAQISEIVTIYHINEVVFCAKDLTSNQIIELMGKLHHHQLEYKIAPPGSLSIIGSSSINRSGDIYIVDVNSISNASNRQHKRAFDFFPSFFLQY
jgi:O-antigen biosynthesis protein